MNPGSPAPDSSSAPSKVSYKEDVKGSNYEELKRENETEHRLEPEATSVTNSQNAAPIVTSSRGAGAKTPELMVANPSVQGDSCHVDKQPPLLSPQDWMNYKK